MDGDTGSSNEVLVSVGMITYNHEKFIAQAIEGVLMQKTNFKYELVIGEDCSTDGTRAICIDYRNKYPDIIKLRLPDKNLGMRQNSNENLKACRGKYIALCEGDDYWTDPYKLQKQAYILENPDNYNVIAVVTNASRCDKDGNILLEKSFNVTKDNKEGIYTMHDFFRNRHHYPTLTVLFRNELENIMPELINLGNPYLGDWIFWILLHQLGNFYYSDEVTACYRINPTSITHTVNGIDRWKYDFVIREQLKSILPNEYGHYLDTNWYAYFRLANIYRKDHKYLYFIYYIFLSVFSNPVKLITELKKLPALNFYNLLHRKMQHHYFHITKKFCK